MIYAIIVFAIIFSLFSSIVNSGCFFAKLGLSAVVAAVAFLLVYWITAWAAFMLMAKICMVTMVVGIAFGLIRKILGH